MNYLKKRPGFFIPGKSNRTSIEFLLADFINDRNSDSLLQPYYGKKVDKLASSRWGEKGPLERVIKSNNDLIQILKYPKIYGNSICIIEPAKHVGTNQYRLFVSIHCRLRFNINPTLGNWFFR